MEFWFASENTLFVSALYAVAAIGLLELIGLALVGTGLTHLVDVHLDQHHFPDIGVTNWLLVRDLPLMVVIVLLLAGFGLSGLAARSVIQMPGVPFPMYLNIGFAVVGALTVQKLGGTWIQPLFRTETEAVSLESLVGRIGILTSESATVDLPGEARVKDEHGNTHYVTVVPLYTGYKYLMGQEMELVEKEGYRFKASAILTRPAYPTTEAKKSD